MQLALLGTDPDALALAAAATSADHQVVWLGDVRPEDASSVARLAPTVAPSDDWESLLDHGLTDAVIVGRGAATSELRAEQLKRLVTDAVPVVAVHPVGTSVLLYYELDMAQRGTHGVLHHYHPLAGHPAWAELARWVRDGHEAIGPIHQVTCERALSDATRPTVLGWLARDAELLQTLAGGIQRVTAIGPRDADASYASLQVQMTGRVAASLRWTVAPAVAGASGGVVTLVGERGAIAVRTSEQGAVDQPAETVVADQLASTQIAAHDAPSEAIARLAAAVDANRDHVARSTWGRATRSMEVVDAAELSLQKGRSIDVHHQQLTEQLAFRGTMAAFGCGLLLLGFVAMLLAGVVGDVVKVPLLRSWPLLLLVVLAAFLLLQLVPLLAAKRPRPAADEQRQRDDS